MKVRATARGYTGAKVVEIGEEFEWNGKLGKWMLAVDGKTKPAKASNPAKEPVEEEESEETTPTDPVPTEPVKEEPAKEDPKEKDEPKKGKPAKAPKAPKAPKEPKVKK